MIVAGSDNKPDHVELMSPIRATRLVADVDIPSKPSILRAMDAAGDDLQAVCRLIMKDPALSMSVLKVVNCAWFALPVQIQRIDQAVYMLGLKNIKTLSKALCIRTVTEHLAEPKVIKRFWRSAILVAQYSSTLARYLQLVSKEEAYALGLIHDCGIPLLSSHYQSVEAFLNSNKDNSGTVTRLEREHFGVCHSELGHRLAKAWSFPDSVCEAILHHHALAKIDFEQYSATNRLICILKLAEYIADEPLVLRHQKNNAEWQEHKHICLEHTALTEQEFEELKDICHLEVGALARTAN